MGVTKKGWDRQCMMSLLKKETTYDAGVTMDATAAHSMKNFDLAVDWPDKKQTDRGNITNTEHGTTQVIVQQAVKVNYKEQEAKPNTLAGLACLAMGASTSSQDGSIAAYRHRITPVVYGTALPSIQVEERDAKGQYAYKGVKCDRLKLSGKAGGFLSLEAELLGSGTRATSATAFVASMSESWMRMGDAKIWLESGADISVVSSPAWSQGLENISSGTPDILAPRMESFEFLWDNKLREQPGFGGGLVLQDADYSRRMAALKFTLSFNNTAELDYYTAQTPCAFELNLKGAQIVTASPASNFYYGGILVIPRFHLKDAPLPKGGPGDTVMADYETEIFNDGTNSAAIIEVFNGIAAYLAAA